MPAISGVLLFPPRIRSTRAATLCYNSNSRFHFNIHTVPIYLYTCMQLLFSQPRPTNVIFMLDPLPDVAATPQGSGNISLTCDVGEAPTSRSLVLAQAGAWSRILFVTSISARVSVAWRSTVPRVPLPMGLHECATLTSSPDAQQVKSQ